MQPSLGVLSSAPDDGVLRGRDGAGRWLVQVGIFMSLMLTGFIMILVMFFQRSLIAMIVLVLLVGALASSVAVCSYAWAWLGFDWSYPVLFDLAGDGLEVGTWKYCLLSRERWPLDSLRDVRVYSALLEFTEDNRKEYGDPVRLQDLRKIEEMLPGVQDVALEFWNTCRASCLGTRHDTRDLACAFIGARVDSEVELVRLSRYAWNVGQARGLLELAATARRHAGLPEGVTVEPAEEEEALASSPIAQSAQGHRLEEDAQIEAMEQQIAELRRDLHNGMQEPPAAPTAGNGAAGALPGGSSASSGAAALPRRARPEPEIYGSAAPQQTPGARPPGGSPPAVATREPAAPLELLPTTGASADDYGPPAPRPKRRADAARAAGAAPAPQASTRRMAAAPPEPESPAAPPPPAAPHEPQGRGQQEPAWLPSRGPPAAAGPRGLGSSALSWLDVKAAPKAQTHGRAVGGRASDEPPSPL